MKDNDESSILWDAGKILLGAVLGAAVLGTAAYFIAEHTDTNSIPDDAFDDENLNGEDETILMKNQD